MTSGCVINTCGWVTGGGFKILMNVVESFKGILLFNFLILLW